MNNNNNNSNIWNTLLCLVLIIGLLGIGFYLGRRSIDTKPKTEYKYIKGDTIIETIYVPTPVKEETPPIDTISFLKQIINDGIYKELWPERIITEYIEIEKQDTTDIVNDWATKRFYTEKLFDVDTLGKCEIEAEVQYNRLRLLNYNYVPVIKEITNTQYKIRTFSPFLGAGYMTNPVGDIKDHIISINGGIFIKEKYGLQVQYMRGLNSNNDYVGANIIYKF
jgi:hypothetical protein